MIIMQGTTPSLQIKISPEDFGVSDLTALDLMVKNTVLTTYGLTDVELDTENNAVIKRFTAEETAALSPEKSIIVQALFYFADGSVVGMEKISISVADMLGVGS